MNSLTGLRADGTRPPRVGKCLHRLLISSKPVHCKDVFRKEENSPTHPPMRVKYLGKFCVSIRLKFCLIKSRVKTSKMNRALCKKGRTLSFLSPFLSPKERDKCFATDLASFLVGWSQTSFKFWLNKLFPPFRSCCCKSTPPFLKLGS